MFEIFRVDLWLDMRAVVPGNTGRIVYKFYEF